MRLKSKRMSKHNKLADTLLIWGVRILFLAAIVWFVWAQNNFVISEELVFADKNLPKSLVGYRIVHVSDFKNTNNNVYSTVRRLDPDIIVLTGGYSDADGDAKNTVKEVEKLCKIAPVYYVYNPGDKNDVLANTSAIPLIDNNVIITRELVDTEKFIKEVYGNTILKKAAKGDEESLAYIEYITTSLLTPAKINLMGFSNYLTAEGEYNENLIYKARDKAYEMTMGNYDCYNIALLGNFNLIEQICKADLDAVLFGGTFGTNQISDKYVKGMYAYDKTTLFVSSGVGNKDKKIRILNFPCVQCIVLSDGSLQPANPLEDVLGKIFKDVGTIFDNDDGFKEYNYSGEELQKDNNK